MDTIKPQITGRALALICLLLAGALNAGCGAAETGTAQASNDGPPQHGGSLVVSLSKEPPVINPWLAPGALAVTWMLIDGLNDPLVTLDEAGRWQPVLIEQVPTPENGGVKITEGGMSIQFKIRQAAAWSDGVPITCKDVAFTWRTVMNPKVQMSNRLGWDRIEAIDCPTPRDVVIRMEGPYALYMSRILALPPLPEHALKGKDFNTYWSSSITVSSGAFLFKEWQRGVRVVIVRNPDYWNRGEQRKPYLDKITFRFVKDANTLKMQLRMNEADVAMIPADTNLKQELEMTDGISFAAPPSAAFEQLVLQTKRPPLNNLDVRKAIAHAVDRKMIVDVVLRNQVPTLQSAMVATQDAYRFDSFKQYVPNEALVKKHLEAAGYTMQGLWWTKNGKPLKLTFVAGAGSYPYRSRVAQLVQEQLRRQGIQLEIQLVSPEVLYSQIAPHGKFDIGEWSEQTGIEPAPSLLFGCDQIPKKPQWAGKNRYRYCRPEVDELLKQADETVAVAERAEIVRKIDERLAQDVPTIPLFQAPDTIAWADPVNGVKPNPASGHTWNIEDWWVSQ